MNIFLIGVGGQGIGLLSEAIIRAIEAAGMPVRGVDTHGLAQRGGTVISYIRCGATAFSPLIKPGEADVAIALEAYEALRALNVYLKDAGTLVYYDTKLQPLAVRLKKAPLLKDADIETSCRERGVKLLRVHRPELPDSRMQNVAVLSEIARGGVIPGVTVGHFEKALGDLMQGPSLEQNLKVLRGDATTVE